MAEKSRVVLECDVCGADGENDAVVETHRISVDGYEVEFETCEADWAELMGSLAFVTKAGRKVKRRKSKVDAVPFPGSTWQFTAHALQRIGERHLDPVQVVEAAENPATTTPGKLPESRVHRRGDVKAVVIVDRNIIITAAGRGQRITEDEEAGAVS